MIRDAKTPFKIDIGKAIDTVSSEVVSFIKTDGTADAGEISGTIVYACLAKSPILNKLGDCQGEYSSEGDSLSTSLDLTTGVMDSTMEVGFVYDGNKNERLTRTAAVVLAAGEGAWALDYFNGTLVICKATAGTSQIITSYKARKNNIDISGGTSSITSIIPGTAATNLGKAEDAAHTSGDVGMLMLGVRKDTAASTATTDGDYTAPIFNSTGHQHVVEGFAPQAEDNTLGVMYTMEKPTASATNAVTLDTSTAAEASSVTKASSGRLYGFVFSNGNGATRYLQFFNTASVPADTAIPFLIFKVAAGETLAIDFPKGIPFATGICWCNSITQNTKTIGSADSIANIFYT